MATDAHSSSALHDGPSVLLRQDLIEALRRGTVPERGLELFAVGVDRYRGVLAEELDRIARGRAVLKAIRGEYGCGKSFMARWFQQQALLRGMAVAEVQISVNDTPLHRYETVYRRVLEGLRTPAWSRGAFRALLSGWLNSLEDEVLARGVDEADEPRLRRAIGDLLEQRLAEVSATQPQFAAALRAYHQAVFDGERALAEGLMAWLMGQPNVGASIKRAAGLRGDIDHRAALGFLRGLLTLLGQSGSPGLMLVLDEVETIQRARADSREKSLNALRQLIDELYSGRYPGLYILITGTPAFFEGAHGIRQLPPLAQRMEVSFPAQPRFDNLRAVQLRLQAFDLEKLVEVGLKIRDLYPSQATERVLAKVDESVIRDLARGVVGQLGGKVGVAPRIFLKKLVAGLLDPVDLHPDFEPRRDFELVVQAQELKPEEREEVAVDLDAIELEL